MLTRAALVELVRAAVEPLPVARALWEGGSTSFGRTDAWSDVDLSLVVADEPAAADAAFAAVERALARGAPVELEYRVPEPAWHGHSQRFYRFVGAPKWLLLDLAVMRRGDFLVQPEVHGRARVLFDRAGVLASVPPVDVAALRAALPARVAALAARFEMFQILVQKEVWRGQPLDALNFYRGLTLAPLTELLRLVHDPERAHFGGRYLHRVLPPDAAARLSRLSFVGAPEELLERHAEAVAWFRELSAAGGRAG